MNDIRVLTPYVFLKLVSFYAAIHPRLDFPSVNFPKCSPTEALYEICLTRALLISFIIESLDSWRCTLSLFAKVSSTLNNESYGNVFSVCSGEVYLIVLVS
jgi:hypothetical protein